jgi:hypothetical protein
MPFNMMHRVLVTLLAIAPAICGATDTLDCSGDLYALEFHVGSEGVADFTLFRAGALVVVGARADLAVHLLEWANEKNSSSKNIIEVSTKGEFPVPFSFRAKGDEGHVLVGNVTASLACDWQR